MNINTMKQRLRNYFQLLVIACLALIVAFGFIAGTVSFVLIIGVLISIHWLALKLRKTRRHQTY